MLIVDSFFYIGRNVNAINVRARNSTNTNYYIFNLATIQLLIN